MNNGGVRHIFHLAVNGGERHRFAILIAADVAAAKGYRVDDMTRWTQTDYIPDLVISKADRFVSGAHRRNAIVKWWVEIVDTSDPSREWVRLPAELLKIDISKCDTMDQAIEAIKRGIP